MTGNANDRVTSREDSPIITAVPGGADQREMIAMNALHEALSRERMRAMHAQLRRERLADELASARRWQSVEQRARAARLRHSARAHALRG